jgi:hypothetical protein
VDLRTAGGLEEVEDVLAVLGADDEFREWFGVELLVAVDEWFEAGFI